MITKEGLKLINELQESIDRSQELLIEPLSEEDRVTFMKLLTQLVETHERNARS